MIEFQEFKVFWEKLKKWMVRIRKVSCYKQEKLVFFLVMSELYVLGGVTRWCSG